MVGSTRAPESSLRPRILLVDDHELVRTGIASLLEADWEICGQAVNGADAINKVRQLKPDLVLLDLGMPILGGTAAAREIRKIAPEIKIIFLSMHESETIGALSKLVHVDAYLTKGCSPEKLKQTIRGLLDMQGSTKTRWQELCERAAMEQDPQKLLELVQEINHLLAEQRNRLENKSSNP